MKNIISILILVTTFGCNEYRENNMHQSKNNMTKSTSISVQTVDIKHVEKNVTSFKGEISNYSKYSELTGIKFKDKQATYSIIATYLGSELNDYLTFGFKGDDGKYYDFSNCKNNLGDIPFTHYDSEIKSELIGKKFIINWRWKTCTYNCCEGEMDLHEDDFPSILSIKYHKSDRSKKQSNLIKSINTNQINYKLYENLLCVDTLSHSWTTRSLSIFKNGILEYEYFKDELPPNDSWPESSNSISVSTIRSNEKTTLIQINFDCAPCAPGDHTISLIQFQGHNVKKSKVESISGRFITKKGVINGLIWQGYFSYEIPYKITEKKDRLDLEVDTSMIKYENEYFFLKIIDGIGYTPEICIIKTANNPFENESLMTNVTLNANTKVTLIYRAAKTISPYTNSEDWIKIKVSDQECWIKNSDDLTKIGFFPAG